jgi:hypothetical protein
VEEERGGPAGPFANLEVIRRQAGMPTARFTALIGVPERIYRPGKRLSDMPSDDVGAAIGPLPGRALVSGP